ncbi:MFS transporter [Fangia hongkongensis]|uniref:MFS transporter n=3 Tax=Fangia hongkongensis TaxID=270495 RepID=UPI000370CB65|nr:MFS transporter [Fangia hongkongensis]
MTRNQTLLLITFICNFLQLFAILSVFSLITLYFTTDLGLSQKESYQLGTALMSLSYCFAPLAGVIISRLISTKCLLIIAIKLYLIGCLLLIVSPTYLLKIPLAFMAVGVSFIAPCLFSLFSSSLSKDDHNMQRYFTVLHFCTSASGLVSITIFAAIIPTLGYNFLLISSAILSFVALAFFYCVHQLYTDSSQVFTKRKLLVTFLILTALIFLSVLFFKYISLMKICIYLGGVALFCYFLMLAKKHVQTREAILMFIFFCIISVLYFSLATLCQTSILFFIKENVCHSFIGCKLSAEHTDIFLFLGSMMTILVLTRKKLARLSSDFKLFFGLAISIVALLLLPASMKLIGLSHQLPYWMIIVFPVVIGIAEVFVYPSGLASIRHLIPASHQVFAFGAWDYFAGIGILVSMEIALKTASTETDVLNTNPVYYKTFLLTGMMYFVLLLLLFFLYKQRKTVFRFA